MYSYICSIKATLKSSNIHLKVQVYYVTNFQDYYELFIDILPEILVTVPVLLVKRYRDLLYQYQYRSDQPLFMM